VSSTNTNTPPELHGRDIRQAQSLRCQASRVAGVTGNTCAHRRRGISEDNAANHSRSAGLYRTGPVS
jgi:hypothetical protein